MAKIEFCKSKCHRSHLVALNCLQQFYNGCTIFHEFGGMAPYPTHCALLHFSSRNRYFASVRWRNDKIAQVVYYIGLLG